MNFTLYVVILTTLVATPSAASLKGDRNSNEEVEEVVKLNEDGNRDKRGFVLTPLSALPASAVAPLLPFLRAVVPPPLLNKLSPLLPAAPLVDASAPSQPILPGLLTATAPLVSNRLATTETPKDDLPSNSPQPTVVVAQQIPEAPRRIPATAFAFTTPVLSAPLISPPIGSNVALSSPTVTVNKATVLPQPIPTVPRPAFTSNYLAYPTLQVQSNFGSLTSFPSVQYFGRSVFI